MLFALREQVAVLVAEGNDQGLQIGRQAVVGVAQIIVLGLTEGADAHLVAAQEQDACVVGIHHILNGLEQGELVVAGLGGVGAELGAVAALVAHLVHMDDLVAAVGHGDSDIGPVGAGVTQFSQTVWHCRQRLPSQQASLLMSRVPFLAMASALVI